MDLLTTGAGTVKDHLNMVKLDESEEQSIYVPVPVSQHSSHRSESHTYPQDDDDRQHVYR